ncbi:ABC transporter substrate-binding protein [Aestuariicoccus sp. MJ-SS9]|uniref:ABC transporter substrate-binding protein n=1 Tax=Aestuariicoccus sp. MJ-SS9 TaxID=3079855 RepID=UPI0029106C83|nr:ABC transporter substrate-binding protein [Aestuariicoccus sp. MJ-SS9]MDU8913691.1 ABC transporter substrate-binding protein [Aestuariicoccus sp. MJ-SS9]
MRPSRFISLVAALFFAGAAAMAAPQRVVSLNLCTDQLALLLAPDRLVSVTPLARDPRSSAMAEAAAEVPVTDGSAEAVVLLDPDLVLAGSYTTRATVEMLQRLGLGVEIFAPVNTLEEARANILRMGALLEREARARQIVEAFDARLAELRRGEGPSPRVALYYALGNTAGRDTLPGDILAAAGMENIAAERGLPFGGALPLEELVLADPDLVLIGRPYGGHARATELLQHPVLRESGKLRVVEGGADWTCETPALLDAVAAMRALRLEWAE